MITEFESYSVESVTLEAQGDGTFLVNVKARNPGQCAAFVNLQYRMGGVMRVRTKRDPWSRHADGTVAGSNLTLEVEGPLTWLSDKILEKFWWSDDPDNGAATAEPVQQDRV